jgi:hypothetical protein
MLTKDMSSYRHRPYSDDVANIDQGPVRTTADAAFFT